MKIMVVGTGYVGLVSGCCLAEVGHTITCVDVDAEKVEKLKNGISPIFEPGLSNLIKHNVENERLFFTTDIAEPLKTCAVAFIAVGTPEGEDGSADLKYVKMVAKSLGELMTTDMLVIVKSTVPVGTCDMVEEVINGELSKRGSSLKVSVASNPEFLKEGAAIDDFMKPDRIVVGVTDSLSEKLFKDIYLPFIMDDPSRLMIMERRSSELTKYGSNAMLATRISFMNELSRLCEKVGANVDDIRRGMGADDRIGKKFLYSGPGYGGSCFPKDVEALVKSGDKHDVELTVLKTVQSANVQQKKYVAEKIKKHFGNLNDKKIAVWGLAFKPGTDDVRETPAQTIIETLLDYGAKVVAHDPEAKETFQRLVGDREGLTYAKDGYEAIEGADAMVLVTEWSEYKRPNWEKVENTIGQKIVFDFRNQYSFPKLKEKGFHYVCIGRKDSTYLD